jgi:hypothetical protein
MPDYERAIERVRDAAALLSGRERHDAERAVALCREVAGRPRSEDRPLPTPGDDALRRELGRLTELLGRRSTRGLPAAALGRAALADLAGDRRSCEQALTACESKLQMLGL